MGTTLQDRVVCSLQAVFGAWFVFGAIFAAIVKGPGAVGAWLIWGTPFFVVGVSCADACEKPPAPDPAC